MRKVVIWVSEDEEEFDNEEECIAHEAELMDVGGVRTFDVDFGELDVKETGLEYFFADAAYMYIVDEERAKKVFRNAEYMYGVSVPKDGSYSSGDVLAWNEDGRIWELGWMNVSKIVAEYGPIFKNIMERIAINVDKNIH